jgi:hypothetical protein
MVIGASLEINDGPQVIVETPTNPANFFNGAIDEVQINNRELTGSQLQTIFNNRNTGAVSRPSLADIAFTVNAPGNSLSVADNFSGNPYNVPNPLTTGNWNISKMLYCTKAG